jgi:DNA-binding beta-propeller fold protein YncE
MNRRDFLTLTAASLALPIGHLGAARRAERRFLYITEPGIRNYVTYGGVGVLVYDIDKGYEFVKRIPTWAVPAGQDPDNVKGVAASAKTGKLFISTIKRLMCLDLISEKPVWDVAPEAGCDRLACSPDGKILYVPSLEGAHWNVIDAATGATIRKLPVGAGAHNTIYSADGAHAYLADLHSPMLAIADTRTHSVVSKVGPFSNSIRPFTVNGAETLCYVNVNELLGFEIGDIKTGKTLHQVIVKGYEKGPVDRHGCPSHGIGLTPDETELWVADGHNKVMHVFDSTVMPPTQMAAVPVRDQPGWITFSMDGRHAYPSTGEIFDVKTKKLVKALKDETGRDVGSEKLVEIVFDGTKPVRAGDQFGIGRKGHR